MHITLLHNTFKEAEEREKNKKIGKDTHEKVILYNPDQSLDGENFGDRLEQISEFDIDQEFENVIGKDSRGSNHDST